MTPHTTPHTITHSITPVQNHVMCGLAAVFAWLLRLSHALQAGKRVEVDTLSIVIRMCDAVCVMLYV